MSRENEQMEDETAGKIQHLIEKVNSVYVGLPYISLSHVEDTLEFFARRSGSITVVHDDGNKEEISLGDHGEAALGFFEGNIREMEPEERDGSYGTGYDKIVVYELDNVDYDFYGRYIGESLSGVISETKTL